MTEPALAGRFVVQAHDAPPLHFDLMLECGTALSTWGLTQPPERAAGTLAAEPKADHRLDYLDFEGDVSGGRGNCRIWDRGTYRAWRGPGGGLHIDLCGERLQGWFRLEPGEGAWMWQPSEAPVADAPVTDAPVADADRPATARGRGPRRDRPRRRGPPAIVRVLQVLALVVLVGGISYYVTRGRYHRAYRAQAYCRVLELYRDLLQEKDALRFDDQVRRFEARVVGEPALVIGRIGAIEPAGRTVTHGGGPAVYLWVDVPNPVEQANSTPLDVRCIIARSQLDVPMAAGPAHCHRWQRGDVIIVSGTLERIAEVDRAASHATLVLTEAVARDPGFLERHFYADEARSLGEREPLSGIWNLPR